MIPTAALAALLMQGTSALTSPLDCAASASTMSAGAFVTCARQGTEKYKDHQTAVLDGYRQIGRDFPAMGEHWIRASLVFDGRFEASRPEVLNYVVVDGKRELFGVGYAMPLLAGEKAPPSPAGASAWHDHARTIEDETVLPHHHEHGSAGGDARLAMLHAWIWSPNPSGMFAADNWALPLLRLKLSPIDSTPALAKSLALGAGGRAYFEMAIAAAANMSAGEKAIVTTAIDQAESAVQEIIAKLKGPVLRQEHRVKLTAIWLQLWNTIDAALPEDATRKLAHLPIR